MKWIQFQLNWKEVVSDSFGVKSGKWSSSLTKFLIVVSAAAKNVLDSWWLFVYVIYAYVYITCKLNTALAKQQLLLGFKMDFVSAEIWIEWRKKSDSEKSERSLTFKTFENDQTSASGRK